MIQSIKCLCLKNKDLRSSPESTWEAGVQAYGCHYSEDEMMWEVETGWS